LDIRHLGEHHLNTKLREVKEICNNFLAIEPVRDLIPVRPTQHYSMGGVRTNKRGEAYGLQGLFSAGESACWDMHGFNRLGGNSLAETVVAGMLTGGSIVEFLQGCEVTFNSTVIRQAETQVQARIKHLTSGSGSENVYALRNTMQDTLMANVSIFRNEQGLQTAVNALQEVHQRSQNLRLKSNGVGANAEMSLALRLPGMIRLALCVAYGALQRKESRGSHAREDFPARNDRDWLNRTLATWQENADLPTLNYEPASAVFDLPPGDRGYGGGKIIKADDKGDQ
jgi:fumarate reductase flavoprotein subunit